METLLPVLLCAFGLSGSRPRVAIGGIMHESNSFHSVKTGLSDFRIWRGPEILTAWENSNHELAGYIEGARRLDFELYPTLFASATPSGPVTDEALNALSGELIQRLQSAPALDGLLLALHGAMVAESHLHADAEIVRRVRNAMGKDFRIVVTHDFHANISPEIVELSTVLLTYQTNPHVDQRARGLKAAGIMSRLVRGEIKPAQALAKPAMLYNILYQNTNAEPLRTIVEESRELEDRPEVLAASIAGGYQYADTPAMGPSAVVVTNGDPELARSQAERLSAMLWSTRDKLELHLPDPSTAVEQAMAEKNFPVVLVDMGDNIGGGSPGDGTFLLGELLRHKAQGWVVVLADPEAVQAAVRAGAGQALQMMAGGKTDRLHGDPVAIRGRVKSLHDGKYFEPEVRHGGDRHLDQGLTAVIEVEGSTPESPNLLMLTTRRQPPFSLRQLISCGISPERQRILTVKAAIAYRAAYEPIAARIIEVDTGGVTAFNPARFPYRHVRRPLFGLEP